jgi:hypothetical protein
LRDESVIEKLLTKLNAEFEPEVVPVKVEEYSTENNCFFNVQRKIRIDGGKIHYGWILHENEFFYVAERHAVWEKENEDLIDITPSQIQNNNSITFLSDNQFEYNGQLTGNVRINSTKNKIVDDYIYMLEKVDYVKSLCPKKSENDNTYPAHIEDLILTLNLKANIYYTFIKAHGGTNQTKCLCGKSNKSYKNCHGKIMKDEVNEFIEKKIKGNC